MKTDQNNTRYVCNRIIFSVITGCFVAGFMFLNFSLMNGKTVCIIPLNNTSFNDSSLQNSPLNDLYLNNLFVNDLRLNSLPFNNPYLYNSFSNDSSISRDRPVNPTNCQIKQYPSFSDKYPFYHVLIITIYIMVSIGIICILAILLLRKKKYQNDIERQYNFHY